MSEYRIVETRKKELVAIGTGFNWWAFFFSFWWSVFGDLKPQFVIALVGVLLIRIVGAFYPIISLIMGLALSLLFGVMGNDWQYNKVVNKGGVHLATLEASSKVKAVRQFMESERM